MDERVVDGRIEVDEAIPQAREVPHPAGKVGIECVPSARSSMTMKSVAEGSP